MTTKHENALRGQTLVEVIIASLLLALIAGGSVLAFLASLKHSRSSLNVVDAVELAQQTTERLRNRVACDDSVWFDASCNPLSPSASDPIPADHPILKVDPGAGRSYTAVPFDCDGDLVVGDCIQVQVTVTHQPPQ